MTGMPVIESIRDMSRRGVSNAEIQRRTGVSQPTIRKYLAMKDFSPEMPRVTRRTSILDPYKPFVDAILTEDEHVWGTRTKSWTRIGPDRSPDASLYGRTEEDSSRDVG